MFGPRVHNTPSSSYNVDAAAELDDPVNLNVLDHSSCSTTTAPANSYNVCFGKTDAYEYSVYVKQGGANGQLLQPSGWV